MVSIPIEKVKFGLTASSGNEHESGKDQDSDKRLPFSAVILSEAKDLCNGK